MNDVVILSESYAVVRYAGPYVAAKSAREAGYNIKILDHMTKHSNIIEYLKQHLSKNTSLVIISSTFLYSKSVNRATSWDLFTQFNLNLHFDSEDQLEDFFVKIKNILPKNCKLALAGERVNKVYNFYKLIPENHPIKKYVDLYFLGRDDNVLMNFLENKNYEKRYDKFILGKASAIFKNIVPPTMIYTKDDCVIDEYESLTIEISRGCAFNCKYCNYDKKTINKLEKQALYDQFLRYYDLYGTTNYNFTTDCFNDSIKFVENFFEVTNKLPFKIKWSSYARPDLCARYPEVIDMMIESGAVSNFYGIETLNKNVGKSIGRGLDFDKILDVFKKFKKADPDYFIKAFFIIGLPGETTSTIQEAINWIGNQQVIDAGSAQVLSLEPTFDDINLLVDVSEFSSNPKKYGFQEVRWKPDHYWKHSTMDLPTAETLFEKWDNARKQNNYMVQVGSMAVAEMQSLRCYQKNIKEIIKNRNFDLMLQIANNYRKKYFSKMESLQ